jgi:tetratricopeptide (TPR) repeat protein
MGDLWIQVMTRNDRDRVLLNEQVRRKMLTEDIVGYETRLRLEGDRVPLHDDAALIYLELQQPEGAVRHFGASLEASPFSAAAHFNLATALTAAARGDAALAHYRRALELSPDYSRAHTNIGFVLASQGKIDAAAAEYLAALLGSPDDEVAHRNLAEILLRQGHTDSALSHAREALRIDPRNGDAHRTMARVYQSQGEWRTAIHHLDDANRAVPESIPVLIELAWLLAQAPDPDARDATRAIGMAEQAVELSSREDAAAWDALGAAYAAGGFFQRATAAAEAALRLAPPPGLRAAVEQRVARYRSGQP